MYNMHVIEADRILSTHDYCNAANTPPSAKIQ